MFSIDYQLRYFLRRSWFYSLKLFRFSLNVDVFSEFSRLPVVSGVNRCKTPFVQEYRVQYLSQYLNGILVCGFIPDSTLSLLVQTQSVITHVVTYTIQPQSNLFLCCAVVTNQSSNPLSQRSFNSFQYVCVFPIQFCEPFVEVI